MILTFSIGVEHGYPAEHRAKALHNEKLLNEYGLAEGGFAGWAITILFYSALHWFRALAAQEGVQIMSYTGRTDSEKWALDNVRLFADSPRPFDWYRELKDESRAARYEMKQYFAANYHDLRENLYEPFKSFVISHLHP